MLTRFLWACLRLSCCLYCIGVSRMPNPNWHLTAMCHDVQYESNSFYVLHHSGAGPYRRITCYFVGAFLSAIFNLLLIIFLGTTAFELSPVVGNGTRAGHKGTNTGTATV